MALRPQDLLVAVKLALGSRQTYPELARALGLSLSEAHAAVKRATAAGLIGPNRTANRGALLDFLVKSTRGAFAPARGPMTRGMPTAHGAPPLNRFVERGAEALPVWPDPDGTERGESFMPLYRSVPGAARRDPRLYEALSLIDALRGGRARDRRLAEEHLRKLILPEEDARSVARTRYSLVEPRREKIVRLLGRLVGPGVVAWYQSGLALLAVEPPILATSHLVAHIATEIESSARWILLEVMSPGGAIKKVRCETCGAERDSLSHKKAIRLILDWLEIPADHPVAEIWTSLAGNEDGALHKRRHRDDLCQPRSIDPEFWQRFETLLDVVLDRFEARYSAVHDALDELAATPSPGAADAKKLMGKLPQTQIALAHFFASLQTPAWIKPLASIGIFDSPPEPEQDATGSTHRRWHALEYLLRLASQDPEGVAQIALAIRPSENSWVNLTLAQIALAVPANLAAPFAARADQWLTAEALHAPSSLSGHLVGLVQKLAAGEETEAALVLFRSLCEPEDPGDHRRPRSRLQAWDLMLAMSKLSPVMARLGEPALRASADLLERIAVLHATKTTKRWRAPWDDRSPSWRESVAEGRSPGEEDLSSLLVSITRDIAIGIVEPDPSRLGQVVEYLESRRWDIFRRLALYLLAQFGVAHAPDLVAKHVLDRRSLRSQRLTNEYAQLLRVAFPRLSRDHQDRFLALIEAGPSSEVKNTPEGEAWICGWLKVIEGDLPPRGRTRLHQLEASPHGETAEAHGAALPLRRFAVGGKSPFSDEELERMTTHELVAAVQGWKPSDAFGEPDRTGLRNVLTRIIGGAPEKYADVSPFKELEPFYLAAIVDGFAAAAKAGRTFDWARVVDLGAWLMSRPTRGAVVGETDGPSGVDADRVEGRKTVLRLIENGLCSPRVPVPIELGIAVWSLIDVALSDPDGTTDDRGELDDVVQRSSNHVRSKATDVAIDYAVWLRTTGKIPGLSREVREALDCKVRERSPVVRAIFGMRIDALVQLDAEWCESNARRIFDATSDREEVAWRAYLEWQHFDLEVFRILAWKYDTVIDRWQEGGQLGERETRVAETIGDHLGRLYWNRRIGLNDRTRLLRRFLTNASPKVTGDFFERIGRWLHEETPSPDVLARLRFLWETRDLVERREEAAAFSWWFSSGRFDEAWALDQFNRALAAGGYLAFAPRVGEQLLELVPRHLPAVLACLSRLLIDPEHHDGAILTLRGAARTVVERAMSSADPTLRREAEALANRLLAMGHSELSDLMPSTGKPHGRGVRL